MTHSSKHRWSPKLDLGGDVLDRLQRERNVWLCTIRPDGSAHVTPVWFCYLGDTWWVSSDERNVKVGNVAAEPRVSLALEDGSVPVVAEGTVEIYRDRFPAEIVRAFAAKYDGWDITVGSERGGARVLFEVQVTRWLLAGRAQ